MAGTQVSLGIFGACLLRSGHIALEVVGVCLGEAGSPGGNGMAST